MIKFLFASERESFTTVLALMDKVEQADEEIRFVGGCVRDSLLGNVVDEIDLATTAPPDILADILVKNDIRVILTGRLFGTITALYRECCFEITTLRRDFAPDGRHAEVVFTRDWDEDAQRRDLTINGLYADRNGEIYDYVGGVADLKARILRFIGDPEERIKEDYLRLLRFFRFWANLDSFTTDARSLESCAALSDHLVRLSGERIWQEMTKLLTGSRAPEVLKHMLAHKIKVAEGFIINQARLDVFGELAEIESFFDEEDALRRLSVFCKNPHQLSARLKLSRLDRKRLTALQNPPSCFDQKTLPHRLYYEGVISTKDILLTGKEITHSMRQSFLDQVRKWERPIFPLGKTDWQNHGIKPGPKTGYIRDKVEQIWVEENFPSRDACLEFLRKLLEEK